MLVAACLTGLLLAGVRAAGTVRFNLVLAFGSTTTDVKARGFALYLIFFSLMSCAWTRLDGCVHEISLPSLPLSSSLLLVLTLNRAICPRRGSSMHTGNVHTETALNAPYTG